MTKLNNFRLSYETAMLFVLSYEYNIAFARLLDMFNISDKIFWAYLSLLSPMSKMGVRKASQLSKTANRIYKSIHGIKDKKKRKVDFTCLDDDGNPIYLKDGTLKIEKHMVTEYLPVVLDDWEQKIKDILVYYTTKGYSNGEVFYTDEELMDKHIGLHTFKDTVTVEGEIFSRTTKIEYILEKFFPDITTSDYRELSTKNMGELIEKAQLIEDEELVEQKA